MPSPSLARTRSPDGSPDQPPLALTDSQLDQIMRCAAPLHPRVRRLFVEHVAYALCGKGQKTARINGGWRSLVAPKQMRGMSDARRSIS
jgi:hypothetical protein